MNIFKSLSQGNGTISETNITSFLSYLLNSTNELDNSFLLLFFDLVDRNLSNNKITDLLQLGKGSLRERVFNLSKNYSITAIPEYAVKKEGSKQIIDVYLKISTKNKKEETDIAYALIENKIKPGAANKEQAGKQFEYFTSTEEYQKGLPVYSLILTSDFEVFSSMHQYAASLNSNTVWLKWTTQQKSENTIESALRNLLILEQHAEIQPINPNSQFILKSFIDYIVTEFSNSSTGERNFNFNGSDEVEKAQVKIDDKLYILRRYENKMIRLFDDADNVLDIEVLPLLRRINEEYHLSIDRFHSKGTNPKNTQVFGKEVINALNNLLENK